MAASISRNCSPAAASSACACARSKPIVAPSGSCSSSPVVDEAERMTSSTSARRSAMRRSACSRSWASRSAAPVTTGSVVDAEVAAQLRDVTGCLDVVLRQLHPAVLVHNDRRPAHAGDLLAVHRLLAPGAVGLQDLVVG